jgi:hypothetical protein
MICVDWVTCVFMGAVFLGLGASLNKRRLTLRTIMGPESTTSLGKDAPFQRARLPRLVIV